VIKIVVSKKSKFNVDISPSAKKKRTLNGHEFSSDLEFKYYKYLLELQEQGKVKQIELQPKYQLQPKYKRQCDGKSILPIYYVSDFRVTYSDDSIMVVDTKGQPDNIAILKRKMFEYLYPDVDFHWLAWSKQDGGWIAYDELVKLRKQRKKDKTNKNNEDSDIQFYDR
jgi:hypothetical protein